MKTLFFIRGNPTQQELAAKEKLGVGAVFRDVSAWHEGDYVEHTDRVAGHVPQAYAHIPRADAPVQSAAPQVPHTPTMQPPMVEEYQPSPKGKRGSDA